MDKLHNIKGIFLDLGGTLMYPPSGSWLFSELAYQYFPRKILAAPENTELVRKANEELESNHLLHTTDEEYERFTHFYKILAENLPELKLSQQDLRRITDDKVYNMENYRIYDDTIETLRALSGRYKLGVISDTWPSVEPMLAEMRIRKYFDCVTYSFELGAFKPSPVLYQDAVEKMGLPPENTLFVDDRPGNVLGARKLGIQPVLIRHPVFMERMGYIEPVEGVPSIDRISGLLDLLSVK